ncbi:MAG TPA: hypothetical protein VI382_06480 [Candidatus Manganitrophaceae bacterium]|nr:hypothetical protein [Candidatus Manganitrophaceae bacterium]
MPIPTEPIGGIPRPRALIDGINAFKGGRISQKELDPLNDAALRPFGDDTSASRETAFEKIRARVAGVAPAARALKIR